MFPHPFRHEEFGVFWPAVMALCQPDFLLAKRFAVLGASVLLVRRTVRDMAIDNDQTGPSLFVLEGMEGALEHIQIVRIAHACHVPAVTHETCCHVIAVS